MLTMITLPTPQRVGTTHVYALSSSEGIVLIDSGYDDEATWQALSLALEERGLGLEAIRAVLLTHSHGDHIGLAHRLKDRFGTTIYVHEAEAAAVAQRMHLWGRTPQCLSKLFVEHGTPPEIARQHIPPTFPSGAGEARRGLPPGDQGQSPLHPATVAEARPGLPSGDPGRSPLHPATVGEARRGLPPVRLEPDARLQTFKDGERLSFGDLALTALHCPGHSPGSAVYWHESSATLFTGDHLLHNTSPSPFIYFSEDDCGGRTRSLPDFLAALAKLRDLPARQVLPGHGEVIGDLQGEIDRIFRHQARRSKQVLRALDGTTGGAFALLQKVFPHLPSKHFLKGMFEVIGHLDVLIDEGRIVEEKHEGRYYYRASNGR